MACRYYMFCQSDTPCGRADLLELLRYDYDFVDDHKPTFEPPRANGPGTLLVDYDAGEGHLRFEVIDDPAHIAVIVDEQLADLEASQEIAARLRNTKTLSSSSPTTHRRTSGKPSASWRHSCSATTMRSVSTARGFTTATTSKSQSDARASGSLLGAARSGRA